MKLRSVVLFDLDLTLLEVPGDDAILAEVLDTVTGVPDLLSRFDKSGRTERWIVSEAIRLGALRPDGLFERYAEAYTPLLRRAVAELPCSALPGALELLDALSARPEVVLGIATGNMRPNAIVKLEHAGLARYFDPLRGAFGEQHDDRADIFRAAAIDCEHRPGERLVFLGDTRHDIRAALALDAIAIGVATGHATAEELRTAGAAAVLDGLDDGEAALGAILGP